MDISISVCTQLKSNLKGTEQQEMDVQFPPKKFFVKK